jgi:pimeloyl-ACP methyl ester carboxylesterase
VLTTLLGGRAFAERFGTGEPQVVALHGWARTRADWSSTLQGMDALAIDLPGHGATPAPEDAWGSLEYAEWLAEILDGLRHRPVLVGHSFGGRVAVQLAATHPDLVDGVVLTGVPLYRTGVRSKPRLSYRLARSLHANGVISDARMEALRRKHGSDDYRNANGVMRDILVKLVNEAYDDQVATIAAVAEPIRLVWGEHDTAAPTWMAERAGETLDVKPTIVAGSGHLLDPGLVAALREAIGELA